MGTCLELLQPFSPGRTLMLTDIVANGVGLLLGLGLATTFFGTCLIEVDACLFHGQTFQGILITILRRACLLANFNLRHIQLSQRTNLYIFWGRSIFRTH
jgi:hypothetical protein